MSETHTDGFDELRRQAQILNGLLADSQPGLFTWMGALSQCCLAIGDLGGVGRVSAMPDLLTASKDVLNQITSYYPDRVPQGMLNKLETAIARAETKGVPPDA